MIVWKIEKLKRILFRLNTRKRKIGKKFAKIVGIIIIKAFTLMCKCFFHKNGGINNGRNKLTIYLPKIVVLR